MAAKIPAIIEVVVALNELDAITLVKCYFVRASRSKFICTVISFQSVRMLSTLARTNDEQVIAGSGLL